MRSLVLGGSTFVGRRLVRLLAGSGHEVAVLNRGRTPSELPPGVRRYVADRTDVDSMRSALAGTQWDAVFDVSGFVMVAGGSPIADLLALFDGRTAAATAPSGPCTAGMSIAGRGPRRAGGWPNASSGRRAPSAGTTASYRRWAAPPAR